MVRRRVPCHEGKDEEAGEDLQTATLNSVGTYVASTVQSATSTLPAEVHLPLVTYHRLVSRRLESSVVKAASVAAA